jgi:phenylpropionate dioxygenase-like ring-hydroxylating dioxygenase large terminal subunit
MWDAAALGGLVGDGRTSRLIYTDPEIFELELSRIFGTAWIYVGHESQLRTPGDFFTTRIGRERVIVARHTDGEVYAFMNRCSHRGAEVCPAAEGNAKHFMCPYHAWTFRTDGTLESLPLPDGYTDIGARTEELGLERVPRVDHYQGFWFASLAKAGPSLQDFLGQEVREAFDNFVARAPGGRLERTGGRMVQTYRGNWKLQIENSIDLLHPLILHHNAVTAANGLKAELGAAAAGNVELEATRANGLSFGEWDNMRISALDRGHCWMGGFLKEAMEGEETREEKPPLLPWQTAYRDALNTAHGPEKAEEVLAFSRHNTIVYPNLFVNPGLQQIRILQPIAPDHTEQHGFIFRLEGAPEEMFHTAVRAINAINAPSSIVTTDDHEVFERIQEALASGARDWLDWSRGIDSERPSGNSGRTGAGTNEVLMRNQHRAWGDYMTAGGAA